MVIIAIIILVIAWSNYINISIAKSFDRAKEVAVRKVNGAAKSSLISQFMFESTFVNLLALVLAIGIVAIAHPVFANFSGYQFDFNMLANGYFLFAGIGIFLLGILFSGFYPALVLSSVKPIETLKGEIAKSGQKMSPARSLVVAQFAMSLFLIAGTIVVYKQIQFMQNQPLGINTDNTMVLKFPAQTANKEEKIKSFVEQVENKSDVNFATVSGSIPGKEIAKFASNRLKSETNEKNRLYEMLTVDFDYFDAYNIELLAGRSFKRSYGDEIHKLIINEVAMKQLELASVEEALNRDVLIEGQDQPFKIIGVTKNWHHQGLTNDYTPVMMIMNGAVSWVPPAYISINFDTQHTNALVDFTEGLWYQYFSNSSFDYFFVDTFYDAQYKSDKNFGALFTILTGLALLVSCLGLYALAAFAVHKRTKEMGIRKVLGAGIGHIVYLFTKEMFAIIGVAVLLATPLSIWVMNNWLDNYPFRTDLEWWIYLAAIITLALIALSTILSQSLKAAFDNPVQALKSND